MKWIHKIALTSVLGLFVFNWFFILEIMRSDAQTIGRTSTAKSGCTFRLAVLSPLSKLTLFLRLVWGLYLLSLVFGAFLLCSFPRKAGKRMFLFGGGGVVCCVLFVLLEKHQIDTFREHTYGGR
jgi:hypothetical protein